MPEPQALLHGDGLFTLTTYRFTTPPEICVAKHKDLAHHPEEAHAFTNLLFTGKTDLPVSEIPLCFNAHGGGFCLLYTSPSPRDRQKSRMPSSA